MLITLELRGVIDVSDMPEHDPEIDDHRSFLINACDAIQTRNLGKFSIDGFGQHSWPVDISTDLPVFLEQLPLALKSLATEKEFEVDFYEQGIERMLSFNPCGERSLKVSCTSRTSWAPNPESVILEMAALENMLLCLRNEFNKCVEPLKEGSCPWSRLASTWEAMPETD